jgi:hypothetical protein
MGREMIGIVGLVCCLCAGTARTDELTPENVPPVVVNTAPQAGALDVDPKLKTIEVSFSKDMRSDSWSWAIASQTQFPKLDGKPHCLPDRRTCVLPVQLEPGRTYALWLNNEKNRDFKDLGGRSAVPYLLVFRTRE